MSTPRTIKDRVIAATVELLAGTRFGNAVAALFSNRYEAAQPGSPRRSYVPAFLRDARYDANAFTRWEMARKIRYFQRNTWLIKRLQSLYKRYSVGPDGLRIVPNSSDQEWNLRMEEAYLRWSESPALDSDLPMADQHSLIANTTHIDGGLFLHFTYRKPARGQSVPAIQLIEGHRVSSPGTNWSDDTTAEQVDGVQTDPAGRPLGFWIRDSFDIAKADSWAFRAIYDPHRPQAGGVMHIYDPDRVGMYREITPYHATLNQTHDLDDLAILEMARAKANAEVSYAVMTQTGEVPDVQALVRRPWKSGGETGKASDPDEENLKQLERYRSVFGSRVMALRTGEELKQFGSQSPTAQTQWYWLHLTEQVCESVNIPMVLVLPQTYQGTTTRAILDDANLWFQDRFHSFKRPCKAAYLHFASWAIYNLPQLSDPPADWQRVHITPPRAVNVDVGRNSAAQLAEYAAGITNLWDIAGPLGKTPQELIEKKARGIGLIKQISAQVAKEMGVEIEPAEVCASIADTLAKLATANAANAAATREPDEPVKEPVADED